MKGSKSLKLQVELDKALLRIQEMKAQHASNLGTAFDSIPKAADYKGSCVIVTLTALGGKEISPPFAIHDGLSPKTIHALQDDLSRSFELATMVNPAMARTNFR